MHETIPFGEPAPSMVQNLTLQTVEKGVRSEAPVLPVLVVK
jgi:hypothetical protein